MSSFESSFLELPGCPGHCQVPEPFERTRVVTTVDFSVTAVTRLNPDQAQLFELSKPALYGTFVNAEFLGQPAVPLPVGVGAEDAEVCVEFFCRAVELLDVHIPHPLGHVMFGAFRSFTHEKLLKIFFSHCKLSELPIRYVHLLLTQIIGRSVSCCPDNLGFFFRAVAGVRRVVDILSLEITAHPGAWRVL
ncbi:hypothetical protein ES703_93310 [subsurface metagenome]